MVFPQMRRSSTAPEGVRGNGPEGAQGASAPLKILLWLHGVPQRQAENEEGRRPAPRKTVGGSVPSETMMKLFPFSDHRPRILLTAACAAALVLGAYSLPDRAGVPAVTGEEDASLELVSSHETGTADYVAERDNGLQQVTIKNPAPKKDAREGELLLDPAAESVANYINRSYRIPLKQCRPWP